MSTPHRSLQTIEQPSWTTRSLAYELHKGELIAKLISGKQYANAFEHGCADGMLSFYLAQHCSRLLCCDSSATAVQMTRRQLAGLRHAHVERRRLPAQWPEGRFDLILLNEIGCDLDSNDMRRLVMRARMALAPHGTLIACHQRQQLEGRLDGDSVHEHLHAGLSLSRVLNHREPEIALDVWRAGANNTAM
jgi:predicted O-methyltransferase YrrM